MPDMAFKDSLLNDPIHSGQGGGDSSYRDLQEGRKLMMEELRRSMKMSRLIEELPFSEDMEFNLSDFALFLSVMKNREAHQNVLSIIMEEPELQLAEIHVEEVVLNRIGKRAIRLDAWAVDNRNRHYATEMQNDTEKDDVRRRARYYQGLLDTPLLKSGRETRYRHLPSTIVTFITQEDIFGRDLAKYTFKEQCQEIAGLCLEDGTTKIFLNMTSRNGDPTLVSLLQYMKKTRLDNPEVVIRDERIRKLDEIVTEVKQSEEWEAVKMSILSVGIERGREEGLHGKLKEQTAKKLAKGKNAEIIAEELEEELPVIEQLIRELEEEQK